MGAIFPALPLSPASLNSNVAAPQATPAPHKNVKISINRPILRQNFIDNSLLEDCELFGVARGQRKNAKRATHRPIRHLMTDYNRSPH
jgi:hypothetical protein